MKVGNKFDCYTTLEVHGIDFALEMFEQLREKRKLKERKLRWYKLLCANKMICPISKEKVTYFCKDIRVSRKKGIVTYHWNFYSEKGSFFTIDHIKPLSKGGAKNDVNNLQPMLIQHNEEKSNKF